MTIAADPSGADARPPYQVMPPLTPAEYEALRADIRLRGVLVPVEIDAETGAILDGHHRVRACEDLGIRNFPRVVRSGLTHEQRIAHALALNLNRRHLDPQARAAAVAALRAQGWSTRRIARETHLSQSTVVRDLHSGDPAGSPALVTGADGKRYAARRPRPIPSVYASNSREQRRAQDALTALGDAAPGKVVDLRRVERIVRDTQAAARRAGPPVTLPGSIRIEHTDFRHLTVSAQSVDLILTDPPYRAEDFRNGLWDALAERAAEWLRPGGYLAAYCGQMQLPDAIAALSRRLDYWWTVAVLHDRGTGTAYVRQRAVANAWKPVLIFRAPGGDPQPSQTLPDVITGTGRAKAHHPWEQGVDEAEHLLRALTHPGDQVLDLCLGSGTTAVAAIRTGRSITGCDIDPEHVATARQRAAEALTERVST